MLLRGCDRPNRLVGVTPNIHADHVAAAEVVSEVGLGSGEAMDAHAGGGDALGVEDVAQVCVGADRWTRCQKENTKKKKQNKLKNKKLKNKKVIKQQKRKKERKKQQQQ